MFLVESCRVCSAGLLSPSHLVVHPKGCRSLFLCTILRCPSNRGRSMSSSISFTSSTCAHRSRLCFKFLIGYESSVLHLWNSFRVDRESMVLTYSLTWFPETTCFVQVCRYVFCQFVDQFGLAYPHLEVISHLKAWEHPASLQDWSRELFSATARLLQPPLTWKTDTAWQI